MYYSTGVCYDNSYASCKRFEKFKSITSDIEEIYGHISGVAEAIYVKNSASYPNVKKDDINQITKDVIQGLNDYLGK